VQGRDEDADDNGEELLSLLADTATSEDDSILRQKWSGNATRMQMSWLHALHLIRTQRQLKKELLMSEVTKVRVEDDDRESALSR
jgi:hypothetical protein